MKLPLRLAHESRRALTERSCSGIYTPLCSPLALSHFPPTSSETHQRLGGRHISTNATTSLKEETRTANSAPAASAHEPQAPSTPLTSSPASSSISDQVRLLMRRVPYPVAIITATDAASAAANNNKSCSFRGMTVSSFNTVTLTPHPVISFNVRRPSETLNALLASGRFLVHLLSPSAATATLARDFAKGNTTLASMLNGHGAFEFAALKAADLKCGDGDDHGGFPLPILRRKRIYQQQQQNIETEETELHERAGPDFPLVFECTLHPQKIEVHDHSIVLGTVVRAIHSGADTITISFPVEDVNGEEEQSSDKLCLTYANTRFWKIGSEI